MKKHLFPGFLVPVSFLIPLSILVSSCSSGEKSGSGEPIYLNTAYSFEERAADLVSRMTLEEKQSQLGNVMPAIPRLGINAYNVWGEALHGVLSVFINSDLPTTSFPNSVAIGASWDPELMEKEANAISDEARGLNAEVISNLTFWSPVVEPVRDPRWGRTGESFGEDPFLIGQIGGGFVRGMMGYDDQYIKAVPCGKHYFANNSEFNRHTGSSDMDLRDAREFYTAPYRYLIEDDNLPAIMSCYNAVNGVPVSANKYWIDTIARKTFGLNGYVTGDCGAIEDIATGHFFAKDHQEATSLGLKAGVDTDCGNVYQANAMHALAEGLINEADIDQALVNLYTVRMRIGEFDPKEKVPYSKITAGMVNTPEHNDLAIEVATRTPVLLKNEAVKGTTEYALPLQAGSLKKIAVFGPMADRVVLGPYSGTPDETRSIAPLAGIRNWLSENGSEAEVTYRPGANSISRSDLFYLSDFDIVTTGGTATNYDATRFDDCARGVLVSSWRQRTLKGLKDGDWTSYNHVNLNSADRMTLNLRVTGLGGTIEARLDSPTGPLLASFNLEAYQDESGRDFGRFGGVKKVTSRVSRRGTAGDQTLVLVFHSSKKTPIDRETISLAEESDVAIVYVGTDDRTASEEADRYTLLLPGNQYELIDAVSGVNPNTIVVIQSLGMVEVDRFKDNPNVAGIIWTGYNGQAQGTAMARVLFGQVNPGGKLNVTWYKSLNDLPGITDYDLRGGPDKNGRTYWYFDKDVSYEFGYGLSYTTFEYSNFSISKSAITPNDHISVSADVRNTGDRDGDEVVQVYVRTPDSPASLQRPIKRLKGFRRVAIAAGATEKVEIDIDCSDLWFWDPEAKKIAFDQGEYVFEIGSSSRDIRGEVSATMSGALDPELKTVTAECGKVVLSSGEKVRTMVTAALSDDSFYDVTKARITYKSSDPSVARVDRSGQVTAEHAGAASITAVVTIDGLKVSGSYPVKVAPDLTLKNLALDGVELASFSPDVNAYSVRLPEGTGEVPQVTATATGEAGIDIMQAKGIPGTAVITVTDNRTGEKGTYKVNYGSGSVSDEFDGTGLGNQWSLVNESKGHWALSKGTLMVDVEDGSLNGSSNNARNLLLQDANNDWIIESGLLLPEGPLSQILQGGLIALQDDDNYVKLVYRTTANRQFGPTGFTMDYNESVQMIIELEGAEYIVAQAEIGELLGHDRELTLSLEKQGSRFTGSYTIGGTKYELDIPVFAVLSDIKAGLLTCRGEELRSFLPFPVGLGTGGEKTGTSIAYDYFHITGSGPD